MKIFFSLLDYTPPNFHQYHQLLVNNQSIPLDFFSYLKNANVSQLGMDINLTTALYSETTNPELLFDETKTIKKQK